MKKAATKKGFAAAFPIPGRVSGYFSGRIMKSTIQ
jgi:hypothetical protein